MEFPVKGSTKVPVKGGVQPVQVKSRLRVASKVPVKGGVQSVQVKSRFKVEFPVKEVKNSPGKKCSSQFVKVTST